MLGLIKYSTLCLIKESRRIIRGIIRKIIRKIYSQYLNYRDTLQPFRPMKIVTFCDLICNEGSFSFSQYRRGFMGHPARYNFHAAGPRGRNDRAKEDKRYSEDLDRAV